MATAPLLAELLFQRPEVVIGGKLYAVTSFPMTSQVSVANVKIALNDSLRTDKLITMEHYDIPSKGQQLGVTNAGGI
ncbi:hypothetical protein EC957_011736 [Mortierella hygrophila]|uniref:Uncharacterized protein n=1 Tax=Mortierella hygrophila TaxID=979708 RepID=A0A9P6F932_9FUNG|nr:hypothetical protein EC957_011736 [Mortierella hygrophila]